MDGSRSASPQKSTKVQVGLPNAAQQWPTPDQSMIHGCRMEDGKRNTGLNTHATTWRTPTNAISERGAMSGAIRLENGHTMNLQDQVKDRPTPSARDHKSGEASPATMEKNARPLSEFACQNFHLDPENSNDGSNCQTGYGHPRRLNPNFVDFLMGIPIG